MILLVWSQHWLFCVGCQNFTARDCQRWPFWWFLICTPPEIFKRDHPGRSWWCRTWVSLILLLSGSNGWNLSAVRLSVTDTDYAASHCHLLPEESYFCCENVKAAGSEKRQKFSGCFGCALNRAWCLTLPKVLLLGGAGKFGDSHRGKTQGQESRELPGQTDLHKEFRSSQHVGPNSIKLLSASRPVTTVGERSLPVW